MKFNRSRAVALAGAVLAVASLGLAGAAQARDVYWSVGVGSPGVSLGFSNAAPVYVAPAPVYAAPVYAPPPVAYTAPAPVYAPPPVTYYRPAPVYVAPPVVYGAAYGYGGGWGHHHHHHHHGWR